MGLIKGKSANDIKSVFKGLSQRKKKNNINLMVTVRDSVI